jgi:hypothetical protein
MNIPRFTAEASLCKTSGHYQTGSHAINLPTQGGSAIYAAMMEVINIHDCAPGGILHDQGPLGWWCDYGGGGGGGPGGGGPSGGPKGGPDDGGGPPEPATPKTPPPKKPPEGPTPGHHCSESELKAYGDKALDECSIRGGHPWCVPVKKPFPGLLPMEMLCCKPLPNRKFDCYPINNPPPLMKL